MLVDKIKNFLLLLLFGSMFTVVFAFAGLKLISARRNIPINHAANFAWQNSITNWPLDLQLAMAAALICGLIITTLLFWLLYNTKWTFQPRRIDDEESIKKLLSMSATKEEARVFAGKYNEKEMYVSTEDRGLVIGPPGTGKTVFLLNQILRAAEIGLSFAAIDIKPEIHKVISSGLVKNGYRVLKVNPAVDDPEADHWNPLADIDGETDISELCNSLLPINSPDEAPFVEAQRDWLKASVFHAKLQPGGSLPSAYQFLSSQPDFGKLLDVLIDSKSSTAAQIARRIKAGLSGNKPDPLILPGLSGCLRSLNYLSLPGVQSALGHSDFSIKEIGTSRPTALFLQFEESKLGALGPLLAFMATGLLTSLINTAGKRAAVAFFLDEIGNMPAVPGLAEKLNTIRSRQLPTWMYFQTTQQIERRYGKGALDVFFASSDAQLFFRLNDEKTRELVSRLIGTTEQVKTTQSTTREEGGRKTTISRTRERVAVIEPHALGQLKPGQVVCLYRGAAALGRATPHYVDFPEFKRS